MLLFCFSICFCELVFSQGPFQSEMFGLTASKTFYKRIKNPENVWGIDFHIFSISGHYSRKIGEELYIGLEAGILPGYNRVILAGENFTVKNTIWSSDRRYEDINSHNQLLIGHLFVRWRPEKIPFEVDGGGRVASYLRDVLFVDWGEVSEFYGGFLKPMIRVFKFSIGGRLDIGYMYGEQFEPSPELVVILSPVIRFNFK